MRDLDADLSDGQRAELLAFTALAEGQLEAATVYTTWAEPHSFNQYTRVRTARSRAVLKGFGVEDYAFRFPSIPPDRKGAAVRMGRSALEHYVALWGHESKQKGFSASAARQCDAQHGLVAYITWPQGILASVRALVMLL